MLRPVTRVKNKNPPEGLAAPGGFKDNTVMLNSLSGYKFDSRERFYFGYEDDSGNFRFESCYKPQDLTQGFETHNLVCLNSFYRKPRVVANLHTLYALVIDIDGTDGPFPLSCWDILERFRELGLDSPTQIIATSPGRFHVVLKLRPMRAFPEKTSYLKKCAMGLCSAFHDLGADPQASTNPVGFIRIPGHINAKYHHQPVVESVFETDTVFSLSEIRQALIDNGIIVVNGAKATGNSTLEERINFIWQNGLPCGKRSRGALTLAIYFNKHLGLSQEQVLEKLHTWNAALVQPLKPSEIAKAVRSAFKAGYGLSHKWLKYLTEDSPEIAKQNKSPKYVDCYTWAARIRTYIISKGGIVESSQRQLASEIGIPWRSFLRAIKLVPGLGVWKSAQKGRKAKCRLELLDRALLKPAQ